MKRLITVLLLSIPFISAAQTAIYQPFDYRFPYPPDSREMTTANGKAVPYASVAAANSATPLGYRTVGQIRLIGPDSTNFKQYWYYGGTADGNLVQKTISWGGITGTLSTQADLQTALNSKQNTLTAGTNITISGNTISSSGGGGGGSIAFTTLADTNWDIGTSPMVQQAISDTTNYVLTGGTNAISRGVLIITKTGSKGVTVNGSTYPTRNNGQTAISAIKLQSGSYYVSSDYAAVSSSTPPISGAVSIVFSATTGVTESPTGTFKATTNDGSFGHTGVSTAQTLPAATDGRIYYSYDGSTYNGGAMFGFNTSGVEVGAAVFPIGFQLDVTGKLYYTDNGSGYVFSGFTANLAVINLLSINRVSGVSSIEYSIDGGSTWANIYTFAGFNATGSANATLYPVIDIYGAAIAAIVNPKLKL